MVRSTTVRQIMENGTDDKKFRKMSLTLGIRISDANKRNPSAIGLNSNKIVGSVIRVKRSTVSCSFPVCKMKD